MLVIYVYMNNISYGICHFVMAYFHKYFHFSGSSGSLIIAIKRKHTCICTFRETAMLFCTLY